MSELKMDAALAAELRGFSYQKPMNEAMARGDSEIQRFYNGLTIFLTGGSGFIGKHLIEKLMRASDIKKVFVLIRPKKGKSTQERLQEMFSDLLFCELRKRKPYFEERIVAIEGNVAEIGLGISKEDWKTIIEEANMIFHVAASIRLDEVIRQATITNVRGTRETLKLGKACKKLKSFVYVSTAYSHTTARRVGGEVLEQFYECPVSPDVIIQLAEEENDQLDKYVENRIKDWPNTYTFTKAIAEELIRTERGHMRACIVRPSIVLCAYYEPTPGWLDMSCMYGPSGIVLGVGLGVIRVIYVDNKSKLSFVPVDYVNNATIAAGWDTALRPKTDINIFNLSTTNCGVTFKHISNPMSIEGHTVIPTISLWYPYLFETNNRAVYWILSWLLHYIPAYFVDGIIKLFGIKKPKELKSSFVDVYKKYEKMGKIFSFFLTNEWNFDETNLVSLWNQMSLSDRQIYNFEMKTIDWDWNTLMWCIGVRKYIMKDELKNTDKAVRKQKWLKLANYGVLALYLLIAWYSLKFICTIMSYILW